MPLEHIDCTGKVLNYHRDRLGSIRVVTASDDFVALRMIEQEIQTLPSYPPGKQSSKRTAEDKEIFQAGVTSGSFLMAISSFLAVLWRRHRRSSTRGLS